MKSYRLDTGGVAATEFALITPILIIILVGIVDYGLYMNTRMKLENTARAAAEYVFHGGDITAIEENVLARSPFYEDSGLPDNMTLSADFACECSQGESVACDAVCDDGYMRRYVEVNLGMEHTPVFNWPGLPETLSINGGARYQVE